MYLPVHAAKPETKSPVKDSQAERKQKILLVDDEEIILSILQRTLERSGYAVEAIKDSKDALDLFNSSPDEFDLVITDLTMPGMTGVDLVKKLIGIRPDVRIILCTGFSDVINEQEAKSLGIRELLLKPSGTGELMSAIRGALEG